MAYATAEDVSARWTQPLDDAEKAVVNTRLEDAELLIKARIPDLDDKVLSGEIQEGIVVMVEAEAVLRLIRNPEGYVTETDGGYSYQLSDKVASGELNIQPREWALLGVKGGVYTISVLPQMPWEAQ